MSAQSSAAANQSIFGLRAASRLILDVVPAWTQELGLLIEAVEAARPHGANVDWTPGAVIRMPFSAKLCHDGKTVSNHALSALADAAMVFACAAAWNGYRPMSAVDQTAHFFAPVHSDVLADARVIRAGSTTNFCRVSLMNAVDRKPIAMVAGAYTLA